jgi:hypothetical protein
VEECIRFSRASGYRRLMLWTRSNLKAARHVYGKQGLRLVKREKDREIYSLSLTTPAT